MLSSHERAIITSECETMDGKTSDRKDLDKTRVPNDEECTRDVIVTIDSITNPIKTDNSELVHISSFATGYKRYFRHITKAET